MRNRESQTSVVHLPCVCRAGMDETPTLSLHPRFVRRKTPALPFSHHSANRAVCHELRMAVCHSCPIKPEIY